jgi:hypothetical protein
MAFKKKEKGNQIYEAISSVLLSYRLREDFLKKHWLGQKKEGAPSGTIIINFLTVLFDGKLYLADLDETGEINISESNNIVYCLKEIKFPRIEYYNIDIVNKDYFPEYLNLLNKDRELISSSYKKVLSTKEA